MPYFNPISLRRPDQLKNTWGSKTSLVSNIWTFDLGLSKLSTLSPNWMGEVVANLVRR